MSTYKLGAYEALQWAWNVLRENEKTPESIYKVKRIISKEMTEISQGKQPEFQRKNI